MKPETNWIWDWIAYALRRIPKNTESILDVGTSRGFVGCLIEPMYGFKPDGIEIWKPYADYAKKFYQRIYVGDALGLLCWIGDREYDVVLAFEVIEHMASRTDAFRLLDQIERVGKRVIVSSPNWSTKTREWDGNPYQAHHCVITSLDMILRGYHVRGAGKMTFYFGHLFRYLLPFFDGAWMAWKDTTSQSSPSYLDTHGGQSR